MHYSVIAGWFGDHMVMPPGKFFTMFHFLEYPFSRGSTHIVSPNPYEAPDFDAGFMNDKRDMAPMVWGYIKSRETARRMDAYAGEVTGMHPFYAFPGNITAGIQHGSWTSPVKKGRAPEPNFLSSNCQEVMDDLPYSNEDIKHIEDWTKRMFYLSMTFYSLTNVP